MKAGYAAIVGRPNTGKSTLLNRILDVKLSAVTQKAQTTRSRIMGIYNKNDKQIIFIDTPGLLNARNNMEKMMLSDISQSIKDADIICHIIDDISSVPEQTILDMDECVKFLIINKIDRMNEQKVSAVINQYKGKFTDIIPMSAKTGDNVDIFIEKISDYLPYNDAFYPTDYLSDKPERFFITEFIREELYKLYGEELPYSSGIVVEEFRERDDRKTYIRANIYIEKESQKGIIIGARGKRIKELGTRSRKAIETFLGTDIFLELNVKVKKNWKDNELLLRRMWNM